MLVRLFDIQGDIPVPSEHCYTLGTLKKIMDEYPDDHMAIYQYLFYMTCPNPDQNPFFNALEHEKEDMILDEVRAEFSTEDDAIVDAMKFCEKLYETPTTRAYHGFKILLDKMADYLATTQITDGKDGNVTQMKSLAKDFDQIRQSFKGVYKDLKEEQDHVRGGQGLAYDQK